MHTPFYSAIAAAPSWRLLNAGFRFDTPSEGAADPTGDAGDSAEVADLEDEFRAIHDEHLEANVGGDDGEVTAEADPDPDSDEENEEDTDESEDSEDDDGESEDDEETPDADASEDEETPEEPKLLLGEDLTKEIDNRVVSALAPFREDIEKHANAITDADKALTAAQANLAAIAKENEQKEADGDLVTRADMVREIDARDAIRDAKKAIENAKAADEKLWDKLAPKAREAREAVMSAQVEAKLAAVVARHKKLQPYLPELRALYNDGVFVKDPDEMLALAKVRRSKSGTARRKDAPPVPTEAEVRRQVVAQHEKERRQAKITTGRGGGSRSATATSADARGDKGKVVEFTKGMTARERLDFEQFDKTLDRALGR